jgi:DNA-binding transcriptional LysR family regulator
MMNFVHLKYLVAAGQHRSFRRAAIALRIAQPTLSKRIRELEDSLGIILFERSTSGAHLTADGETVVARAKQLLSDLDSMQSIGKAGGLETAGRLQIGLYTSLTSGALGESLCDFARQYQGIDINVIEDDRSSLFALLERGSIDMAVVLGELRYETYAQRSLWAERVMVALPKSHYLAERDFLYWTDLKAEQFLVSRHDPGPEIEDIVLSKLSSPGDRPLVKTIGAPHDHLLALVRCHQGIVPVCESSTGNRITDVVYREVRDGTGTTRLGFVAYWQRNNANPMLEQFLTRLQVHVSAPTP